MVQNLSITKPVLAKYFITKAKLAKEKIIIVTISSKTQFIQINYIVDIILRYITASKSEEKIIFRRTEKINI